MDWKFNLYDLFGYLIPGGLFTAAAWTLLELEQSVDGLAGGVLFVSAS